MSGKIDRDERASVDRHLKDCEFCRRDLADAQSWQAANPETPAKQGWRRWLPWG